MGWQVWKLDIFSVGALSKVNSKIAQILYLNNTEQKIS